MAEIKRNIVDVELDGGNIHRSLLNRPIGEGDVQADRFGVRVFSGKEPADLSGASCSGYFIRPDGITLVIAGERHGNEAFVELPEAAYAKSGQFTLAIKISGTGYEETLRIVDGTVVDTTTGTINDPSSTVPSLEDLTAIIDQAEEAAEAVNAISISATQVEGTRYKIAVTIDTDDE